MTTGAVMRAVQLTRFGGPEVLRLAELPWPQPEDDEVLVRVRAASVNPVDLKIREGQFPPVKEGDLPIILGRDLAGTIETCGTRAHNMLSHGDRVFAHIGFDRGAQADYVIVKAVELVAIPGALGFAEAGAVPLAGMTAWQGLFDHGALQPGQRVLIHGAAGGVGHLAVQFAAAKGAMVLATAGASDLDYVRGLGADTVIDYKAERFEDVARDLDLVLDLVGGETQHRSVGCVRPGGRLVSTIGVEQAAKADADARGVVVPDRWMATPNAAQLGEIADLMEAGKVTVSVAASYPLADIAAAHERQAKGGVRGKLVLTLE